MTNAASCVIEESRLWIERVERLRSCKTLLMEESLVVLVNIRSERLSGAVDVVISFGVGKLCGKSMVFVSQ